MSPKPSTLDALNTEIDTALQEGVQQLQLGLNLGKSRIETEFGSHNL